jgi:hypothetical protein
MAAALYTLQTLKRNLGTAFTACQDLQLSPTDEGLPVLGKNKAALNFS